MRFSHQVCSGNYQSHLMCHQYASAVAQIVTNELTENVVADVRCDNRGV